MTQTHSPSSELQRHLAYEMPGGIDHSNQTEPQAIIESLFLTYYDDVLRHITSRYHTIAIHAAEEIVNEAFWLLWKHRSRLNSVHNLQAYINGIARKLAAIEIHRLKHQPQRPFYSPKTSNLSPLVIMQHKELLSRLDDAIACLAESHRLALQLNMEGWSVKQIAARCGCTEKAIQRRLEKARDQLRHALKAYVQSDTYTRYNF